MTEADRDIFYEAVSAHSDSRSTAARLALTAREQGYGGIVLRADPNEGTRLDSASPAEIADAYGIDVVESVEIRTDSPGSASGALGEHRSEHTLVILAGGTEEMNRFAAEEPRVDVLARPMARRGDVDHVIARAAARNGVRIEFDFSSVLRTSGGQRVRALADLRKLRELVEKYDVPYVMSAGAGSHLELRAPRELAAVGEAIGFSLEAVLEGLREWGRLAARNRDLQGGSFIEPGVRVGKHDEQF
ncbi:ribonuclease P [Halobacteriales archaeon QS_3_64_16]|nr:MAG: ribonuclease P [Halobacteriales archaeon QS_3_64_16]